MSKALAIQIAERRAYERLSKKYHKQTQTVAKKDKNGRMATLPVANAQGHPVMEYVGNYWHVDPNSITCPSALIQELPLDGTTNVLTFVFNQNAPEPSPTLNNINLGVNDIFSMYAIQVLFGVGAAGVTRQYYTHGLLAADNAVYQGANMSMQFEQSQSIKSIDMIRFLYEQNTDFVEQETMMLINPLRLLTGRLGTFNVSINMQSVAGLTFTPNAYVSVRLLGVLGQAGGRAYN